MKAYRYLGAILTMIIFLCCGCKEQLQDEPGGRLPEEDLFFAGWTGRLPEWEDQLGPFDGKLDLKEEEWLAIKAENHPDMGANGTFLIRGKGEAGFLRDKIVEETGIISLSDPQIMRGWSSQWQPAWDGTAKAQGYF